MERTHLNDLQKAELEIFKQFLHVCKELKLNYYVVGGTLLGAVRHNGFIPWDDDIDVAMPRQDYEVFVKKGQAIMDEPYFLQTFETDSEYPNNFAKIRNSNTTFIETSMRNRNVNHGVYIDVFPLDYYPQKKLDKIFFFVKNWLLAGRVACVYYFEKKLPLKSKLKRILCKLIYASVDEAVKKREVLFTETKAGNLLANHCGAWVKKEIMPAEWFAEGVELRFEDVCVVGPKECDKYLTQLYGDYMQFPPVEKRIGHHYADVIDLNTPYTEYRN